MTTKRKTSTRRYRYPWWVGFLNPLKFEIESSLPIETVADLLSSAFNADARTKGRGLRNMHREVIDHQTLQVRAEVHGQQVIAYLTDTQPGTRINGCAIVPVDVTVKFGNLLLLFIGLSALMILGFLNIIWGEGDANWVGFFLVVGGLAWILWGITRPWRKHRQLRHDFVATLEEIVTAD